jgi:ribosomal protein L32E
MSYKRKQLPKFKKIGFYETARPYKSLPSGYKPTIFSNRRNVHSVLAQREMQADGRTVIPFGCSK